MAMSKPTTREKQTDAYGLRWQYLLAGATTAVVAGVGSQLAASRLARRARGKTAHAALQHRSSRESDGQHHGAPVTHVMAAHVPEWHRVVAARNAVVETPSLQLRLQWLHETRHAAAAVTANASQVPACVSSALLREEAQIYLSWLDWGELVQMEHRELLLLPAIHLLPSYLQDSSRFPSCCADYLCASGQICLALLIKELECGGGSHAGLVRTPPCNFSRAEAELAKFQAKAFAHSPLATTCRGLPLGKISATRLHAPLSDHFPQEYGWIARVEQAFWSTVAVPVAMQLESHAHSIISQFGNALAAGALPTLARGVPAESKRSAIGEVLASHEVFGADGWSEGTCEAMPTLCDLLRSRPELADRLISRHHRGALRLPAVILHRLSPQSRLPRRLGEPWCLQVHLDLGPRHADGERVRLQVWDEERLSEHGRATVFPEAAEHELLNPSTGDSYFLAVRIWHPDVLRERQQSPRFDGLFEID